MMVYLDLCLTKLSNESYHRGGHYVGMYRFYSLVNARSIGLVMTGFSLSAVASSPRHLQ